MIIALLHLNSLRGPEREEKKHKQLCENELLISVCFWNNDFHFKIRQQKLRYGGVCMLQVKFYSVTYFCSEDKPERETE